MKWSRILRKIVNVWQNKKILLNRLDPSGLRHNGKHCYMVEPDQYIGGLILAHHIHIGIGVYCVWYASKWKLWDDADFRCRKINFLLCNRVVLITIPVSEIPLILPKMQVLVSASVQVFAPILLPWSKSQHRKLHCADRRTYCFLK